MHPKRFESWKSLLAVAGIFAGVNVVFAVAVAFGVAFAVAATFLYVWLLNQFPKIPPVIYGAFWWTVLIAYARLLYKLGKQHHELGNALLLFLGVLPLLNAPLDWLSLGLTRGLLRAVFWYSPEKVDGLVKSPTLEF